MNRDLKQARTATAVNTQLNFTVKNKPHTTNYIYTAYLKHILWLKVCERIELTVLKSFLSNVYQRREGCRRAENGKNPNFHVFRTTATDLLRDERCYLRLTSKQSIQFFHTLLIIKYASNMQYI